LQHTEQSGTIVAETEERMSEEGGGSSAKGWIIFILIFGVGNLILYLTTGIFLIPISRR